MTTQAVKSDVQLAVIFALQQEPMSMKDLKLQTQLHEVPLTIAIRDLQNNAIAEHGYLSAQGDWLDDWFEGDLSEPSPVDAWRLCK